MSYETYAYDNEHGDPVAILVATGTYDVSRVVALLHSGRCEEVALAGQLRRQIARHNGGRAALRVLELHGGPNLLEPVQRAEDGVQVAGPVFDLVRLAVADPGAVTARRDGETVASWSARAALIRLADYDVPRQVEQATPAGDAL